MALSDNGLDFDSHIAGLKAELVNAKAAGYATVKEIEAELKRLTQPAKQTASKAPSKTAEDH